MLLGWPGFTVHVHVHVLLGLGLHCTCAPRMGASLYMASATSGFSGYIKLAYCSSAKGAPVAQLVRASD